MKIINDTEVFEPNECYFAVHLDPEDENNTMISITSIEFWNKNKYLDDGFGDHSLSENIHEDMENHSISNAMEAIWIAENCSTAKAEKIMTDLGFVYSDEMEKELDNY